MRRAARWLNWKSALRGAKPPRFHWPAFASVSGKRTGRLTGWRNPWLSTFLANVLATPGCSNRFRQTNASPTGLSGPSYPLIRRTGTDHRVDATSVLPLDWQTSYRNLPHCFLQYISDTKNRNTKETKLCNAP